MKAQPRILLVDDSEDARFIAQLALQEENFALDAAGSARDAYALLRIEEQDPDLPPDYDLVMLDILMPDIDGVEACAAIRNTRRYRDVPILMVSGMGDRETLNQAFIAGANDYVSKPLNPIELLARIRSALRFKREIDRRRAREIELRTRPEEGSLDLAAALDLVTGLPGRAVLEARIAAAAENVTPTSLLLLSVDQLAAYQVESGEAETARLLRRLAAEISAVPAPLGAALAVYGDGLFMVAGGGITAEDMLALASAVSDRIGALALPHGASSAQDRVTLTAVIGEAIGEPLRTVPAELIERADEAQRTGGNCIIRMDPTR
jgi:PleD family two-component response regulator